MRLPLLYKGIYRGGVRLLIPLRSSHLSYSEPVAGKRLFPWLPTELEPKFQGYKARLLKEYEKLTETITSEYEAKSTKTMVSRWEELRPIVDVFEDLDDLLETDEDIEKLVKDVLQHEETEPDNEDVDIMQMIRIEKEQRATHRQALEKKLINLLVPADPIAYMASVRVEILAGAGGREAGLFARHLLDMYGQLCTERGWQFAVIQQSSMSGEEATSAGSESPLSKAQIQIVGESLDGDQMGVRGLGAYGQLRWEAGVHRVQRVPVTSKLNKIHTSTVAVSVLPIGEEISVDLPESDLRWEYYRASGAGGQHVNRTDSAVRLTHLPTGIVMTCQRERSQHANRRIALQSLHDKLLQDQIHSQSTSEASLRHAHIGHRERSEKIRTYNFPQDRVTDHRVGRSWNGIHRFMRQSQGLSEALQALHELDQFDRLNKLLSQEQPELD